jgi:hypothetical protein
MVSRKEAAKRMVNLKPFNGTLNASGDPESEEGYTVRSYHTPIARVTRHPETGHYQVSHSEQQFSPTTSQHQGLARRSLPGQPGPPIGEQSWTSVGPHGSGANAMSRSTPRRSAFREQLPRPAPPTHWPPRRSGYGGNVDVGQTGGPPEGGHSNAMLISELLPDLYHDRREKPVNRNPKR